MKAIKEDIARQTRDLNVTLFLARKVTNILFDSGLTMDDYRIIDGNMDKFYWIFCLKLYLEHSYIPKVYRYILLHSMVKMNDIVGARDILEFVYKQTYLEAKSIYRTVQDSIPENIRDKFNDVCTKLAENTANMDIDSMFD